MKNDTVKKPVPAETQDVVSTREKILYAAKKEFAEKGRRGARIGEIAKRAGVNQALVHYYFESKDKLYSILLKRVFGVDLLPMVEAWGRRWTMTPPEELYATIYILISAHSSISDPDVDRILFREFADGELSFKPYMLEYIIPQIEDLTAIIERGIASGDFSTSRPALAVMQVHSFIHSMELNNQFFKDTRFYDRFNLSGRALLDYTVEYTFKALAVPGKPVCIPVMKPEIIVSMDELVRDLIRAYGWKVEAS